MKALDSAVWLQRALFPAAGGQETLVALVLSVTLIGLTVLSSPVIMWLGNRARRSIRVRLAAWKAAKPSVFRSVTQVLINSVLWLLHVCSILAAVYLAAAMALDLAGWYAPGIVYVRGTAVSILGLLVFFRINGSFPGVYRSFGRWNRAFSIRGRTLVKADTVSEVLVFALKALRFSFALVSFYVVGWYFTSLFFDSEAPAPYEVVHAVLYAVLATVLLAIAIRAINTVSGAAGLLLREWAAELEANPEETILHVKLAQLAYSGVTLIRFVLLFLAVYGFAAFVLSLFAVTSTWLSNFVGMFTTPIHHVVDTVIGYLPNLFSVVVILVITYAVIKAVKWTAVEIGKGTITIPGFYTEWASPTYKIVRFLIIVFCAVVVFPYLPGSSSPAFRGISIFVGVLFSLGSSGAVSNIVSGVLLTYTRAFRVGDMVKISDTTGTVVEKTLLVTRVRTVKNVDITIPNAMVLGSHITNFSSSGERLIIHTSITIGYDVPWKTVHELLIAAAERSPSLLKDPRPFVHQTSLDDFYVAYEINAYTDLPNGMAATYSELHQNIQDVFNERGIEIMSPHYRAVRDGNQVTIPAEHLPDGYEVPSFRVEATQPHKKA